MLWLDCFRSRPSLAVLELLLDLSAPLCWLEVLCDVGEVLDLIKHSDFLC